jgi:hypothetical protein
MPRTASDLRSRFVPSVAAKVAALGSAILTLLLLCLPPQSAFAQSEMLVHRSYITPFPKGDRYRIVVLGDSFADGLWDGLNRAFQDDTDLEFVNRSKAGTGLARLDNYNWYAELNKILKDDTYQIAVVMLGAYDDRPIRQGQEWLKVGTEAWRQAYGARVEKFIKRLRAANIAVYWVGLPIMRSPSQSNDAHKLNDVFREKAFINGAKYIDTWDGFADDGGRFSAYGPDMSGQATRLRADDGVHFTMRGDLKLANFAEKELRKDLTVAKGERNIPLAGNPEEQARIIGRERALAQKPAPAPAVADTAAKPDGAAPAGPTTAEGTPEQTDLLKSKLGEVSVVRPTLNDTTLQAARSMMPQTSNVATTEPEVITSEIPGGLTAVATISAVTDLSLTSSTPRLPLSQRPYYKVLIRGEHLEPKAGRADDFSWPPS